MSSKSDAGIDAGGKSGGGSRESSIRVQVGTGNERNGSISEFPLEVRQCVHDIVSWYERQDAKGGDVRDLGLRFARVSDAMVDTLREAYSGRGTELPESLQMMFTKFDTFYLYEFQLMSVERMIAVAREKEFVNKKLLPIAMDIDETLLVIDLASGAVLSIDDEGEQEELSRSFGSYLERMRDQLLANKLEFILDSGLVEVVASSPIRGSAGGASKK
eukprot:g2914.t1